jgi:uncharacterized membrane protein YkoI
MMTKRSLMIFILAVSALFLSACQSAVKENAPKANEWTQKMITAEEAQNIALADAGVKPRQVTHMKTEYEVDDGVKEYEVEFVADGWECEYTIDALTGAILDQQAKTKLDLTGETKAPESQEETTAVEVQKITKEEAEQIALDHAQLSKENVMLDRTEFDLDDGVPEYEIEFHADGWEYDYEIHAETGEIRHSQKEKEAADRPVTAPTDPVQETKGIITAEEAENAALSHAKLNRSDVTFGRTEFDLDNGVPQYEVEFRADGWEYDYEIHADTGEVLSADKDRD